MGVENHRQGPPSPISSVSQRRTLEGLTDPSFSSKSHRLSLMAIFIGIGTGGHSYARLCGGYPIADVGLGRRVAGLGLRIRSLAGFYGPDGHPRCPEFRSSATIPRKIP